jgi:hypothetical protein
MRCPQMCGFRLLYPPARRRRARPLKQGPIPPSKIAVHPLIFPVHCLLLNLSVLACYSFPCLPSSSPADPDLSCYTSLSLLANPLFPPVHPFSLQPLTECSSSNSFVLTTIHFHGGCTPLPPSILFRTLLPRMRSASARIAHFFATTPLYSPLAFFMEGRGV